VIVGASTGVAPGAGWIGVKVFNDRGVASTSAIHKGFQWLLDPDGNPATADAPDVVNASWTGSAAGCNLEFQPDLRNLRAAGILPVFSAGNYGFGLVNFANADMVGHTGVIPAVIEAVETVDADLARVVESVLGRGGVCLVTADHGNAEQMLEPDGSPHTAHTTNPVPLIGVGWDGGLREGGRLADIAPTVLELLRIAKPEAMEGVSLLDRMA